MEEKMATAKTGTPITPEPTPIVETSVVDQTAEEKKAAEATKKAQEAGKRKQEEKDKQKKELNEKIAAILAEYNGLEGNIPSSNEYWGLVNTYRSL